MKKQGFYPKQVLRALAGRDVHSLDETERHVLSFFIRRSRKYEISISTMQAFPGISFEESARAILSNVTTKILLKPISPKALLGECAINAH